MENSVDKFDVVIVGAGPGRLNCAMKLEEVGKNVLLLEKNAAIGPKVCAAGITSKDLDKLNIPEEIFDFKYNSVKVESPD